MTKRQKFIVSAAVLSLGLLAVQYIPLDYRYAGIFGFFLMTYIVTALALFEDLKGIEWYTLLSLPSFFSAAVALFYFLLPTSSWSRILIISLFGIGQYALLLTENIYSVAASRTIQLLRAAHAVGFLLTVVTLVLAYNTIFSLRWPYWQNGLLVFGVTWPLLLSGMWAVELNEKLSRQVVGLSLVASGLIGELAIAWSFIPATVWIVALLLGTAAYVILGVAQHELAQRLFKRTITEYLSVGMLVLLVALLIVPWK